MQGPSVVVCHRPRFSSVACEQNCSDVVICAQSRFFSGRNLTTNVYKMSQSRLFLWETWEKKCQRCHLCPKPLFFWTKLGTNVYKLSQSRFFGGFSPPPRCNESADKVFFRLAYEVALQCSSGASFCCCGSCCRTTKGALQARHNYRTIGRNNADRRSDCLRARNLQRAGRNRRRTTATTGTKKTFHDLKKRTDNYIQR